MSCLAHSALDSKTRLSIALFVHILFLIGSPMNKGVEGFMGVCLTCSHVLCESERADDRVLWEYAKGCLVLEQ